MICVEYSGQSCTFPETACILETSVEQIITSKVKEQYLGTVRTWCNSVSKTLSNEMSNIINSNEKKKNSYKYFFELNPQYIFRKNISDLICLRF